MQRLFRHLPALCIAALMAAHGPAAAQETAACASNPAGIEEVTGTAMPLPTNGTDVPDAPLGRLLALGLSANDDGHSGRFAIHVDTAGRFDIAVGNRSWIDVEGAGGVLESTGHRHAPACSSLRKIVSFDLQPGTYTVRISRSDSAVVEAAAWRAAD